MAISPSPGFTFTPEFLEQYSIVRTIGQGAGGYVFEARQNVLNRPVAIKLLKEQAFQGDEAAQRFLSEAKITSRLSHPNIVEIYDFGIVAGVPFAVYEFVAGQTLRDRLTRVPKQPLNECMRLIRGILAGLGHAHDLGVVHRDLKPENILLDRDGLPKVADFGLAKGLVERDYKTEAGMLMGTLAYISPEQTKGIPATQAADVYAVAIILYEMISGVRPFMEENPLRLMLSQQRQVPAPLTQADHGCPAAVWAVLQRALEKDPAARPQNANALLAELEGKKTAAVSEKRKPSSNPRMHLAATPAAPPAIPTRGILPAAAALLSVALVGLAGWRGLRAPEPSPAPARVQPASRPGVLPAAAKPPPPRATAHDCLAELDREAQRYADAHRTTPPYELKPVAMRYYHFWDAAVGCALPELSAATSAPEQLGSLAARLFSARSQYRSWLQESVKLGRDRKSILGGMLKEDFAVDRAVNEFDELVARRMLQTLPACSKGLTGSADPYASSGEACLLALCRPARRGRELAELQARVIGLARVALPALTAPARIVTSSVEQIQQLLDALRLSGAVQDRRTLLEEGLARLDAAGKLGPAQELARSALAIELTFLKGSAADFSVVNGPDLAVLPDWTALRDRLISRWPCDLRSPPPAGASPEALLLYRRAVSDLAVIRGQLQFVAQRLGVPCPPESR